ncbi:hypothetical protein AHiyo4_42310 [Arthrobacter sp. Hiyo4]|nr:hypothetical protein AHiyo4_42310 [Arthrobacter sp. Hiyo4]
MTDILVPGLALAVVLAAAACLALSQPSRVRKRLLRLRGTRAPGRRGPMKHSLKAAAFTDCVTRP